MYEFIQKLKFKYTQYIINKEIHTYKYIYIYIKFIGK